MDSLVTVAVETVNDAGETQEVVAQASTVKDALEDATQQVIDLTGDESFIVAEWWPLL